MQQWRTEAELTHSERRDRKHRRFTIMVVQRELQDTEGSPDQESTFSVHNTIQTQPFILRNTAT